MNIIKQFPPIILIAIFLSSCRTSINEENPIKNLDKNFNKISNPEKKEWK